MHTPKHLRLLEAAQKGALMLIQRAIKSTPLETMDAELCITPIDYMNYNELKLSNFSKKMINIFLTIWRKE